MPCGRRCTLTRLCGDPDARQAAAPPTDWWTVTHNGVPIWFFPPNRRDLAERFATDPAYRLEFVSKKRLKRASKKEGA